MDKIVETSNQTNPQTQNIVEAAVQEALLVAEFFELIPRDPNAPPSLLPADFPLADYLETAKMDMEVPLGMVDLTMLAHFGGKRGG